MIRINLLPHREARRQERKQAFVAVLIASALIGGVTVLGVGSVFAGMNAEQEGRNNMIKRENAKLDQEIKEIATLKQEIEVLKARQHAVEDLQSDRNQPVYVLDELVRQVPEGIFLKSIKQTGQRIVMSGHAQSNERVSELLRNLGNGAIWLERPELIEIRAAALGPEKDGRKIFEFSVNASIKKARDKDASPPAGTPAGVAGARMTASPTPLATSSPAVSATPTKP